MPKHVLTPKSEYRRPSKDWVQPETITFLGQKLTRTYYDRNGYATYEGPKMTTKDQVDFLLTGGMNASPFCVNIQRRSAEVWLTILDCSMNISAQTLSGLEQKTSKKLEEIRKNVESLVSMAKDSPDLVFRVKPKDVSVEKLPSPTFNGMHDVYIQCENRKAKYLGQVASLYSGELKKLTFAEMESASKYLTLITILVTCAEHKSDHPSYLTFDQVSVPFLGDTYLAASDMKTMRKLLSQYLRKIESLLKGTKP